MSEVSVSRKAGRLELADEQLRVEVRLDDGALAFADVQGGRTVIPRAYSTVVFSDGSSISSRGAGLAVRDVQTVEDAHGRGVRARLEQRGATGEPALALDVTLYEERPYAVLQSHVTNTAGRPLQVQAFHVLEAQGLRLGPNPKAWRFYKQGWQNWSPTLVVPCDREDIYTAPPVVGPSTRPKPRRGRFLSELVTAVVDLETSRALTAGFVSAADQMSQLWLDRGRRALTAASYADGVHLPPEGTLSSERLLVDITSDRLAGLPAYGDALAREMKATPWPHVVTGWCSWYYYWQGVSEDSLLANLEQLSALRDELPLEYFQIDDGYQAGIGDWLTPNEKFPHGMAWLADRIRERGFKPGLWVAPFLAGEQSRLFAEHHDWTVRTQAGEPVIGMLNWGQRCYSLDCTRPEVIDWLEQTFRTIIRDWGFEYVKIDFTYAAAVDGVRYDPNVTRAQAYRRGVEAIRRAVSEGFILGCGNPVGASVGLINGMRTGPDVAPYWTPPPIRAAGERTDLSVPATLNAIRNVVHRWWMHNRLWLNDPDCMLARDSETTLTPDEVQTLATIIGMSGGMLLDSDNLTRLSPERRAMLARLIPLRGDAALPLDLFEREMPQVLWREADKLLAVVNWADEAADVSVQLPLPAARLRDFWTGEDGGVQRGTVTFRRLPPHGSKLLVVSPVAA